MGAVLLQILIEGHGLLYHLLMQHRGVEQMQSPVFPYGKAEVRNIESCLLAGDGDDVTIVGHPAEQGVILDCLFGWHPRIPDAPEGLCSSSDGCSYS